MSPQVTACMRPGSPIHPASPRCTRCPHVPEGQPPKLAVSVQLCLEGTSARASGLALQVLRGYDVGSVAAGPLGGQGEVRRAWAAVGGHRWGWGAAEGRTQGSASRKGGRGAEGVFRGFVQVGLWVCLHMCVSRLFKNYLRFTCIVQNSEVTKGCL